MPQRFPRSCGDIPATACKSAYRISFPPFMRGYTLSFSVALSVTGVSPVHAGIYLYRISSAGLRRSFPRSCGDIPHRLVLDRLFKEFPPFMRGYTSQRQTTRRQLPVSPVHAGIYPCRAPFLCVFLRFPRSCGDIPAEIDQAIDKVKFPPFMRGYTCQQGADQGRDGVSPVHAGIYLGLD